MFNIFKKKKKVQLYEVTYHEIDTDNYKTEVMDNATLSYLNLDWAFVIDNVKAI